MIRIYPGRSHQHGIGERISVVIPTDQRAGQAPPCRVLVKDGKPVTPEGAGLLRKHKKTVEA